MMSKPTITLAFDTSTPWLTLVLGTSFQVVFQVQSHIGENHSRMLIQYLEEMKKKNLFLTTPPGRIVAGLGPGSFTGIKIANMTARSIAYSLDCPLFGFSTLEMLAIRVLKEHSHSEQPLILPVIAHKKNEIFWSEFSRGFQDCHRSNFRVQVGSPGEFISRYSPTNVLIVTPWIELQHYFQTHHFHCHPLQASSPNALGLVELMESQDKYLQPTHSHYTIDCPPPLYGSRIFENA